MSILFTSIRKFWSVFSLKLWVDIFSTDCLQSWCHHYSTVSYIIVWQSDSPTLSMLSLNMTYSSVGFSFSSKNWNWIFQSIKGFLLYWDGVYSLTWIYIVLGFAFFVYGVPPVQYNKWLFKNDLLYIYLPKH